MDDPQWSKESLLITGLGATLFLIAVVHHGFELTALNGLVGPLLALVLDGVPALGIVFAGYRLSRSNLSAGLRRTVAEWSLGGGLIFVAVIGTSFLIRSIEGRTINEWQFPLLLAVEIGVLSGFLAGYYNVTAQAESDKLRTVSQALEFVNSLLRHDLRNDLVTIQGQAELISLDDHDPDSGSGNQSVITRKADEALTLIQTTRMITETVVGDPELEPVDLANLTADMVESADEIYDVSIEANLPDEAMVSANDGVRSVVDNLLENAIEHNDTDDPQVTVEIHTDSTADTVQLSIRDNGPGISNQRKERLLKESSDEEAGGGLDIVRALVDGYSGDLRIEDNQPRGSVFIVDLPQARRG